MRQRDRKLSLHCVPQPGLRQAEVSTQKLHQVAGDRWHGQEPNPGFLMWHSLSSAALTAKADFFPACWATVSLCLPFSHSVRFLEFFPQCLPVPSHGCECRLMFCVEFLREPSAISPWSSQGDLGFWVLLFEKVQGQYCSELIYIVNFLARGSKAPSFR